MEQESYPVKPDATRIVGIVAPGRHSGRFATQPRQPLAAELDAPAAHFDFKQIVERLVTPNCDGSSRRQAMVLPVPQPDGVFVLHFANDDRRARGKLAQVAQLAPNQLARRGRNRVPVWVFDRLAEIGRQRLFEARGNGMLQRLRLGIDFAPIETENARQEKFHQSVPPNDAPSLGQAQIGQTGPGAGLIFNPPGLCQALSIPVTDGARTPSRVAISAGETK